MWRFLAVMACFVAVPLTATAAQETVSLDAFLAMDRQTLETVQGKLDYLGPQTGSIIPVTFAINTHQMDWGLFQEGEPDHDRWPENRQPSFTVSVEELLTLLRNAQALLGGVSPPDAWLALTVVAGQPGQVRRFEAHLSKEQTTPFFAELWKAFQSRAAHFTFQWWGCALDLLPDGRATDVTEAVELLVSRFTPDAAGHYAGQVSVRNISQATLPGPVSAVFELSGNAQVIDPDGTTCHVEPAGRPYVHAPFSPPEGLPPGETSTIHVSFDHTEHAPVVFTVKIFAGPASR